MGQPNRHGHGGISQVPVPLGGAGGGGRRGSGGKPSPYAPEPARPRTIPVHLVDAFLEALPKETIQHLALHTTEPFDPTTTAGTRLVLQSHTVVDGQVWILTDVRFYALAPSTGLQSPPTFLDEENLTGLIRFDLLFSDRSPMKLQGKFYSVYAGAGAAALQVGNRSGWPFMRKDFGTQRELSFALYAKEQDKIDAVANVDIVPRFPIAALGVELHGFSMPISYLSRIWGGTGAG